MLNDYFTTAAAGFSHLFHIMIDHSCDAGNIALLNYFRDGSRALHWVHITMQYNLKREECRWLLTLHLSYPFGRKYIKSLLVVIDMKMMLL